jgi:hypothetical protein
LHPFTDLEAVDRLRNAAERQIELAEQLEAIVAAGSFLRCDTSCLKFLPLWLDATRSPVCISGRTRIFASYAQCQLELDIADRNGRTALPVA